MKLTSIITLILFLICLLLAFSGCSNEFRKYYKQENAKAPSAVNYKYVRPLTKKERIKYYVLITAPMAVFVLTIQQYELKKEGKQWH